MQRALDLVLHLKNSDKVFWITYSPEVIQGLTRFVRLFQEGYYERPLIVLATLEAGFLFFSD